MEKKIVSLAALFLKNTLSYMHTETNEELIRTLESNITNEIEETFDSVKRLLDVKATTDIDYNPILKKWNRFKTEKWAYTYLKLLQDIEIALNKVSIGGIPRNFRDDVYEYYEKEWPLKSDIMRFKFSLPTLKNYTNHEKYYKFSNQKIEMLTNELIVPYFVKYQAFYDIYIKWMSDIEHFFRMTEKGKDIVFLHTAEEYKAIKSCVCSYKQIESFDRKSFSDFLQDLFSLLDAFSISRQNKNNSVLKEESSCNDNVDIVRKDIEDFYKRLFSFPEGTTGFVKGEIDNLLWTAANNAMQSYLFASEKKKIAWEVCKKNKGFIALMRYRLYRALLGADANQFIKTYINAMVKETEDIYGVYISENAQLENRVWIDENCKIGNCYIENDVIIFPEVELLAESLVIKSGSIIESNTCIKGQIEVTVFSGKQGKERVDLLKQSE